MLFRSSAVKHHTLSYGDGQALHGLATCGEETYKSIQEYTIESMAWYMTVCHPVPYTEGSPEIAAVTKHHEQYCNLLMDFLATIHANPSVKNLFVLPGLLRHAVVHNAYEDAARTDEYRSGYTGVDLIGEQSGVITLFHYNVAESLHLKMGVDVGELYEHILNRTALLPQPVRESLLQTAFPSWEQVCNVLEIADVNQQETKQVYMRLCTVNEKLLMEASEKRESSQDSSLPTYEECTQQEVAVKWPSFPVVEHVTRTDNTLDCSVVFPPHRENDETRQSATVWPMFSYLDKVSSQLQVEKPAPYGFVNGAESQLPADLIARLPLLMGPRSSLPSSPADIPIWTNTKVRELAIQLSRCVSAYISVVHRYLHRDISDARKTGFGIFSKTPKYHVAAAALRKEMVNSPNEFFSGEFWMDENNQSKYKAHLMMLQYDLLEVVSRVCTAWYYADFRACSDEQ